MSRHKRARTKADKPNSLLSMLPKASGAGGKKGGGNIERKSAAKLQAEYDAKYGGEKGSIPAPAAAAPAVARSPHGDVVPLSTAEVTGIGGAKPSAGVLPRPFAALHFLHCSVRCVADGACNPTRLLSTQALQRQLSTRRRCQHLHFQCRRSIWRQTLMPHLFLPTYATSHSNSRQVGNPTPQFRTMRVELIGHFKPCMT